MSWIIEARVLGRTERVLDGAFGGGIMPVIARGQRVRFTLQPDPSVRDSHLMLRDASAAANWQTLPVLVITGTRSVSVSAGRSNPLQIEYEFAYPGDKTLSISGTPNAVSAPTRSGVAEPQALFAAPEAEGRLRVGDFTEETDPRRDRITRPVVSEPPGGLGRETRAELAALGRDIESRWAAMDRELRAEPGLGNLYGVFVGLARSLAQMAEGIDALVVLLGSGASAALDHFAAGMRLLLSGDFRALYRDMQEFGVMVVELDRAHVIERSIAEAVAAPFQSVARHVQRGYELSTEDQVEASAEFTQATVEIIDLIDMVNGLVHAARALPDAASRLPTLADGARRRLAAFRAAAGSDALAEALERAPRSADTLRVTMPDEARGLGEGARGVDDTAPRVDESAPADSPPRAAEAPSADTPPADASPDADATPIEGTEGRGTGDRGIGDRGTGDGGTGETGGSPGSSAIVPLSEGRAPPRLTEMAATGLSARQVEVLRQLIGRRLDDLPASIFGEAWRAARAQYRAEEAALIAAVAAGTSGITPRARRLFGYVRSSFFSRLAADATAMRYFEAAGVLLLPDGSSARILMDTSRGRRWVTLDVDHIAELSTHPLDALSPGNLMFSFERQNRELHNFLLSMDPFNPDARLRAGRGRSRASRLRGRPLLPAPGAPPVENPLAPD